MSDACWFYVKDGHCHGSHGPSRGSQGVSHRLAAAGGSSFRADP